MKVSFLFVFLVSSFATAQDCTHLWVPALSTNPAVAKGFSGDTHAAYALFSYWGNDRTKLVLKGSFPRARFMSVQTYSTRFQKNIDAILDYEMVPDSGSKNPFADFDNGFQTNQRFSIEIVASKYASGSANEVVTPNGKLVKSFFYRAYAPFPGETVTLDDLPKVEAVDVETNQPVACPNAGPGAPYLNLPQFIVNGMELIMPFEFKDKSGVIGSNAGIPSYLYALENFEKDEVVMIRFKAPISVVVEDNQLTSNSQTEVRYWSFCLQNFVRNETLYCVPDSFAAIGPNRMVTVVVGNSTQVEERAKALGYHFVKDPRKAGQSTLGFAYRNVLPTPEFQQNQMYQGEYRPIGQVMTESDFLK